MMLVLISHIWYYTIDFLGEQFAHNSAANHHTDLKARFT